MAQTSVNIRMDEDLKKQFDNFCSDVGMSMIMAQATFSVRIDETLKKQFNSLCQDFGMNATTAINVFARAVVRQRRIPFEIRTNEPNETTYAAMESAVSGEDIHGPFTSVSEVMEALNA